jgi:hypothetical protein
MHLESHAWQTDPQPTPDPSTVWRTGDLAQLGRETEVWEVTTFWNGSDGTPMATLERLVGDRIVVTHAPIRDLRRLA